MLGRGRFAFMDPTRSPRRHFPAFMAMLRRFYPTYSIVWDTQAGKWLCFTRVSRFRLMEIAYLEDGFGRRLDPCEAFIFRLVETDILRRFGSGDAFCDWLEKQESDFRQDRRLELRAELAPARREGARWVGRRPHSVIVGGRSRRPRHFEGVVEDAPVIRGLSDMERQQISGDLNAGAVGLEASI